MKPRAVQAMIAIAVVAGSLMSVGPASAGRPTSITIDATCNTTNGQYDVVLTLNNGLNGSADIAVEAYEIDATNPPHPVFSPDPVGPLGMSSAATAVPGDTQYIYIRLQLSYAVAVEGVDNERELPGDCVADPTTTVPGSTSQPTTSTTAAQAATVQPAFTG